MNDELNTAAVKGSVLLGVAYAYPTSMLIGIIIGSVALAFVTVRGKGYPINKVLVYLATCGALSVPLFLPAVESYYNNELSSNALTAVTIIATVVTVRFAPLTFSVIEDMLPKFITDLSNKYTGTKK